MQYSLKELRARKNWTQAETAKKLGVSTQTYNAWESDFGKVRARDGKRIAELFGVTLDEIFFNCLLENNSSKRVI
jgi:DNA-binding XRE family transcriptional regulator